jgi:DNA-directed RNA polymerase specialized sigma24 family protein
MTKPPPVSSDILDRWRQHFARQLAPTSVHDRADAEQDLALALLQTQPGYRPERGSWEGFGYRVLARRKARWRRKQATRLPIVEANLDLVWDPASLEEESLSLDIRATCQSLTPVET